MFGLGTTELLIIGLIVLFIFGAKRLPEIGRKGQRKRKKRKNLWKVNWSKRYSKMFQL
jgi:Sec-independent protein translocase protein TatA